MDNNSKIYIENKPAGLTSKDFADIIKEKYNLKKICYCGRLDPMARGQMLLLGDEMCKKMDNNQNYDKVYQFEICYGVQTDTDDPLGIIENYNLKFDTFNIHKQVISILENYNLKFEQNFHKYSSIHINGQPYWVHTKENKKISNKPKHIVEIKNIKILSYFQTIFSHFIEKIIKIIGKIKDKHDFRQEKIIKQWEKLDRTFMKTIPSLKLEIRVSSGFYVRQFVRDISKQIGFPLMVYDINRTNILIE